MHINTHEFRYVITVRQGVQVFLPLTSSMIHIQAIEKHELNPIRLQLAGNRYIYLVQEVEIIRL